MNPTTDYTSKLDKVKSIFLALNTNSTDSDKLIANQICEFSNYKDLRLYLNGLRLNSIITNFTAFRIPVIPVSVTVLYVYFTKYILGFFLKKLDFYVSSDFPINLFIEFGLLAILCIPFVYGIKKIIFTNKFERLISIIENLILGYKEYGINYDDFLLKESDTIVYDVGQSYSKILEENNKVLKFNKVVTFFKYLFDWFWVLFIFNTISSKGCFSSVFWFNFVILVVLSPFAIYEACGEEKRYKIRKLFKI